MTPANEIDYSRHSEIELAEMFGRLDPRYAPEACARLEDYLKERGYLITRGELGPGEATPSPARLQTLIGSSQPLQFDVEFGKDRWESGQLEPLYNALGFGGPGKLIVDGIHLHLIGKYQHYHGLLHLGAHDILIPLRRIRNVETNANKVRFEYTLPEGDGVEPITVQLLDNARAAALAAILPQSTSPGFTPQSKHNEQFISRVNASANRPLLTYCLIAINLLVFIATVHGGADWLNPRGTVEVAWGSNFGPRTANGEWWRLLTSMFIHFGVLHLFFNMWALWVYGRLFERLYGKLFFGLVYGVTGVVGGLTSTAWHPAANSAGASGAIFGILGALIGTQLATRGNLIPREISRRILSATLALVVLSVSASLRKSGIDYAAHLGGLAAGIVLGLAVQRESDLYADGDFVRPPHQKR